MFNIYICTLKIPFYSLTLYKRVFFNLPVFTVIVVIKLFRRSMDDLLNTSTIIILHDSFILHV
ncbi:hypothetical protein GCM10007380_42030 [Gottfriedia solisilvae]|uniref:Uncharacterized protein n=1 Tax=Gottfriedia solisilvae TaxID=1516104 RepID=A0A8J3F0U1_9BACI|nr:hypothetical protein GCM10007380_42030 [Gottfriedia solisilvae]